MRNENEYEKETIRKWNEKKMANEKEEKKKMMMKRFGRTKQER